MITDATLPVENLGLIDHHAAVARMELERERILANPEGESGVVFLCEHPPTITLGRHAHEAEVLASSAELERAGTSVVRASRGGQVTYHGPGQLMIYPVVRLRAGIVRLLSVLGSELARIAATLGVDGAEFLRDPAGVWVANKKIAACGVHIRRRVMIHGFALNLATPASAWTRIVPCGLAERPMESIESLGGEGIEVSAAVARFADDLAAAVATGASIGLE